MIPRRIYLKNFMSYREPREICFRDAKLWALSGENGAGKSTVFDAITYALFDEHRLGKQHADKLIHKGEDQLYIEFDFAIGEDEYRIKRSQNLKGYTTRQILHLEGPNAPEPGRKSPQAIRETDSDEGFKHWIERVIGLNYSAFTSSALLLQGKSDALLKAKPAEKHAILTQIIDLDPYIRLFNRAKEKYAENDHRKKHVEDQLRNVAVVHEQQIIALSEQIEAQQNQRQQYFNHHLALSKHQAEAQHWRNLCEERQQYQEKLEHLQKLLEQENHLKQQTERYRELSTVLPSLQVILQQQERITTAERQLGILNTQQVETTQQKQAAEDALQQIQQALKLVRERQQELIQEHITLSTRQLELAPQIKDIDTLLKKQQTYAQIQQQIAQYPSNIDVQLVEAQQRQTQLQMISAALTQLTRFSTARETWLEHDTELEQTNKSILQLFEEISQIKQQIQTLEEKVKEWQRKENAAQQSVTQGMTLLHEPSERLENLKEIDGTTQCRYCGQTLTPEHLQAERERLTLHVQSLTNELTLFRQTYDNACKERLNATSTLTKTQKLRDGLLDEYNEAQKQQAVLTAMKQGQEKIAHEALSLLSPTYLNKIVSYNPTLADISLILTQSSYPTAQDLQDLGNALTQADSIQDTITTLKEEIEQRDRLLAKCTDIEAEIHTLEQHYSPDLIQSLSSEHKQIVDLLNNKQGSLQEAKDSIDSHEAEEQTQQRVCREITQRAQELSNQITSAQNIIDSAQYILDEHLQLLPSVWQMQVHASAITADKLTAWENEKEQLIEAEKQLQLLNEERSWKQLYEQNIHRLDEKLADIPSEARRPVANIEHDMKQVESLRNETEQLLSQLLAERSELEQRKQRRADLEKERQEYIRLSNLYKSLHTLLGPNSLQRHLLQQAEQAIVAYANETLDKISNGTLRLELAKNAAKGARALDLVAYNYAVNQTQPIEVELLSGSQQFRAAVSLALGIGKYAGGESHRVESVIIDEGFGSLDTQGRQDMIHILQALKDELACIIVVSHQDEFFDEFEHKYRMELVDKSTKVSIV